MQTSPRRPSPIDLKRLIGSVNQLRFNDNKGEVAFFSQKMIILRRDFLRVMREGLERMVGDQAAPFLSYLASGVGVHEGSIFRDSVQTEGEQARAELENLVHTAFEDTNLGWGKIRVSNLNFDKNTADIAITNCFEALENGTNDKPNCMFTSGFLAGLFAEVFDKTVQANELKCISTGSAACEFHIVPSETEEQANKLPATIEEKSNTSPSTEQSPADGKGFVVVTASQKTNTPAQPIAASSKPAVGGHDSDSKPGIPIASGPPPEHAEFDAGVERAARIAKRKQGFWEKHFKKHED